MFTGIITDVGRLVALHPAGDLRARLATGYDTARIDIGASIACDGVCLTVVALGERGSRCRSRPRRCRRRHSGHGRSGGG
jgi:riboflavin synthase alpha subunit